MTFLSRFYRLKNVMCYGSNANSRLILLATQACPHKHDCKFWEHCTSRHSDLYEDTCLHPNAKEGEYKPLSLSLLYQLDLFFTDTYDEKEEYRNKTYPKLTEAIALALGINDSYDKIDIWDKFICNELCQNFTKQVLTQKSDYHHADFIAFIDMIRKYNINKVMICGTPGFKFIRKIAKNANLGWEDANEDEDAWYHRFYLEGKEIIVIYSYHPSCPSFSKNDEELIQVLKRFFSDSLIFENM